MRRFVYILAVILVLSSAPAWANTAFTSFINGAASAGSLTGAEIVPLTRNGATTFKTTTAAIAALASSGGGNTFNVTAYGTVCDGSIVPGGIITASGSPTISVTTASGYVPFVFTSAMVGSTIVLSDSQFNGPTAPVNNFTSTIASVNTGSNTATLAGNVTFTSSSGFGAPGSPGAQMRIYKTTNTTAIQAALNAANAAYPLGGSVVFPGGVCATGQLTFYSGQKISGSGPNASVVMLANGSNSDLFRGFNFSALTGQGSNGGLAGNVFEDIGFDGNKGANTGSGIGTSTGAGDGVRFYGWGFYTNRVFINNFAADGWYSEWTGANAGDPVNGFNSENAYMNLMQFADNAGYAITYSGPHDGYILNTTVTNNSTGGIFQTAAANASGSPLNLQTIHTYQNGGFDLDLFIGVGVTNSDIEGTAIIRGEGVGSFNSGYGTLQLGVNGGSPVFAIQIFGGGVGTLHNFTGTGFNDKWVGSEVTTFTGVSYTPNFSAASTAFGTHIGHYGSQLILENNVSFPVIMQVINSNSEFTIQNGGLNAAWMNAQQQWSFGPSATSAQTGTHLDLHTMTDSMILPTGTTGQRPTGIAGMARYNSTNTDIEAFYGSRWNALAATSALVAGGSALTVASGCGTVGSVTGGSQVGGNITGSFTAGATSCAPVLTLPTAPNGWICGAKDLTNPTDTFTQTVKSTTSCTLSATVSSSDVILIDARWY